MKKIIAIIVLLAAVGGLFFFLNNRNKNINKIKQQPSQLTPIIRNEPQATVTYTKDGFNPKSITIKAGTRVTWINKSGKMTTVNSNDHPAHKLYPPLNLGEFPDNSSVQLVFVKPGSYGYHNHLNPSQTGEIIVE